MAVIDTTSIIQSHFIVSSYKLVPLTALTVDYSLFLSAEKADSPIVT